MIDIYTIWGIPYDVVVNERSCQTHTSYFDSHVSLYCQLSDDRYTQANTTLTNTSS